MGSYRFILRRIITAFLLLFLLITTGTVAYIVVENFSFIDALYMTVITISTVGFREVRPLSIYGRIITMSLIIFGVGLLFYTLGTAIEYFFGEIFQSTLRNRRMKKEMQKLKDHFIVCGYGRVGKEVAKELKKQGKPFVVIELEQSLVAEGEEEGLLIIHGDATEERILTAAGLEKALGIAACVGNDPDNVFITLTARAIKPDIFIVARANSPEVMDKLYRAGANRVISPSQIGGRRIASLLTHPKLSEFLDIVSFEKDIEFQIEQYEVTKDTKLANKTIGELKIRDETGCIVLIVKYADGRLEGKPSAKTILEPEAKIAVLGTPEQLKTFEQKFL